MEGPVPAQRSLRERLVQAVIYEALALSFLTPLYAFVMGVTMHNSLATMSAISLFVVIWSSIYNGIFDRTMWRHTGRAPHEKTRKLRLLHAGIYELTITLFAVPLIAWSSGKGLWMALAADAGFILLFVVYTYIFYAVYDRLRPAIRP